MAGSALANRRSAPRSLILAPFARLRLGALFETRGLLEQATPVYRLAVELAGSREEPLARWMLARLLIREGKYEEALIELEAALKRDLANPEIHLTRAEALAGRGDPEALEAYRAAAHKAQPRAQNPAQDPTDRKLWRQALHEWEAVLAETPRDALAQFSRGVALDALGAPDQALDSYRKAVSLDGRAVSFRLRLPWPCGRPSSSTRR